MRCNFLRVASASVISVELLRLFRTSYFVDRSYRERSFQKLAGFNFKIRFDWMDSQSILMTVNLSELRITADQRGSCMYARDLARLSISTRLSSPVSDCDLGVRDCPEIQ
jgi:hypothetical protein